MDCNGQNDSGFTLLEVTVVMGILGIILTLVYGVFSRTLEGKERAEARIDDAATARTVLSRLSRDLNDALGEARRQPPTPTPAERGATSEDTLVARQVKLFVSVDHTDGGAPLDEIAFSTRVRRPVGFLGSAADIGVVHWFLKPDPERGDRHALYREVTSSLSGQQVKIDEPRASDSALLAEGVAALRFRQFDGEEWKEEWDSRSPGGEAFLPRAIEITLSIEGADGALETYHTALELPLTGNALQRGGPERRAPTPDESEDDDGDGDGGEEEP